MGKMKTYQAISDIILSIEYFDEKTKTRKPIMFSGGGRYPRRYPTYNTDNPQEQKMLEKHPLFNKAFKLKKGSGDDNIADTIDANNPAELKKTIERLQKTNADLSVKISELEKQLEAEKIKYAKLQNAGSKGKESTKDITNIQQAREYLSSNYDIPLVKLPNKTAIINKANELGVVFENLK